MLKDAKGGRAEQEAALCVRNGVVALSPHAMPPLLPLQRVELTAAPCLLAFH